MPSSPVSAATPLEEIPEALLKSIKEYALAEEKAPKGRAKKSDVPKAPEAPPYVPPSLELAPGCAWFSDLMGWTPTTIPNIPVRVFQSSDWPTAVAAFIPTTLPNGGLWTWPKEPTEALAFALYLGDRTLIHGPTGSGKSALVEAWAHLTHVPLIRVNCHSDMQSTDFLGKDIIKSTPNGPVLEYDWSLTTTAIKNGGILLIDEAFRSRNLMALQSLLERNGCLTLPDAASLTPEERKLTPPEGAFWVVLTDNTTGTGDASGSYVAEVQDLSTLDRITATIHVPYMTQAEEHELLRKACPTLPAKETGLLVAWAERMREAFLSGSVMQPMSLRATLAIARKFIVSGDMSRSIRLAYLHKLGDEDRKVAEEAWHQCTATELV